MAWIWLIGSLFIITGFAVLLLADGIKTLHCNGLLEHGETAPATVHNVKKNRRGLLVWDVEFTTKTGQVIRGKRASISQVKDDHGQPTEDITVVYSPEDTGCWDLSTIPHTNAAPLAARRFGQVMTLGFGSFFAFLGTVLSAWSAWKLLRKRK